MNTAANSNYIQWVKLREFNFELRQAGQSVGQMEIHYAKKGQPGVCTSNGREFEIRRTGFWSSGIEIEQSGSSRLLLSAKPKKWYSNRLDISFEDKEMCLKIWNNPLAEYLLVEDGKPLLGYGLSAESARTGVRINAASKEIDTVLHFFLWYLFFPVAQENAGDELPFFFQLAQ